MVAPTLHDSPGSTARCLSFGSALFGTERFAAVGADAFTTRMAWKPATIVSDFFQLNYGFGWPSAPETTMVLAGNLGVGETYAYTGRYWLRDGLGREVTGTAMEHVFVPAPAP